MDIAAIIVAAGRGTRAGGDLPKQWRSLKGRPVADWTVSAFASHPAIGRIVLVLHSDDLGRAEGFPGAIIATGGSDRAASVRAGLEALAAAPPDLVLIHDVARPLVSPALIDEVIARLAPHAAAAPALAVPDALWTRAGGRATGTPRPDRPYRTHTPPGFRIPAPPPAPLPPHPRPTADDVAIARAAGLDVAIVQGEERNLKITGPEDFARAEALMGGNMDIRTGQGFDVHAFEPGDAVILCGVRVPHDRRLKGHSDADVGMHALTDAIYGALADGDIGQHFPPSDPRWKGAASDIFLKHAANLARARGFTITNADVTLICEQPRIGPHAGAMRAELARITGLDAGRIGVKATTSERLGFTGRAEGIAALALATLMKA